MKKQTLAEYKREHARDSAVHYAQYYFKTVWEKTGLRWDSDNNTEIEILVDAIIEAATIVPELSHQPNPGRDDEEFAAATKAKGA